MRYELLQHYPLGINQWSCKTKLLQMFHLYLLHILKKMLLMYLLQSNAVSQMNLMQ